MIVRFRHKGLERFFASGDARGIAAQQAKKLKILLGVLATAKLPSDMNIVGTRLHPLKGDLKGFWSVNVSGNWRLVFRFDGENATDVDLMDYH
jgi:proteic killer suppression protein